MPRRSTFPAVSWVAPWLVAGRKLVIILVVLALVVAQAATGPALAQPVPQRIITIRDAETENLIRRLAHPLFRTAGVDPGLVRITLIQNRAINAFVSTGNRLFIHTGLIQQAGSVQELVGVLAHETGHIAGGHLGTLPEAMRAAMLRSVASMLLGGAAAAASGNSAPLMAGMLGGQASAMGELHGFTRAQEQAADQAALGYLDRLGWSASGLDALLDKLMDQELLAASRQDPYFRTHPLSRDRQVFIRQHLARSHLADAPAPPGVAEAFAMVRAKLDGFIDPPSRTLRRHPPSDTSHPSGYARAIAHFRAGRIAEALVIIDALRAEDRGNPWLLELKGQILFEGHRAAEAVAPYAAASRLAPDEPMIRLSHARVLIELGEPAMLRQAVAELDATLSQGERENPFVWRQMAIAQGRLGQMPLADLALAEEALLLGDAPTARRLAARAETALPPGPQRLRAQDLRHAAAPENLPQGRGR